MLIKKELIQCFQKHMINIQRTLIHNIGIMQYDSLYRMRYQLVNSKITYEYDYNYKLLYRDFQFIGL